MNSSSHSWITLDSASRMKKLSCDELEKQAVTGRKLYLLGEGVDPVVQLVPESSDVFDAAIFRFEYGLICNIEVEKSLFSEFISLTF